MPLGLYVSVPFCRTKCSYCNFASDVFSRAVFQRYVDHVCRDIQLAHDTAQKMGGLFERAVDSVYLGGGTPTVLDITQLERLFVTISQNFEVQPEAEITVECAPGTLTQAVLETLLRCGVNRVSLGVQSFVDLEAASVGRLHKRVTVADDIARLRSAGISNINIDLIAGLPHQTTESWQVSLAEAIASGAPHASVYMLEVDEDSRLGRELIAGGTRYHAHFVPDEEVTADLYEIACERLDAAGVLQYEISNFARKGHESRHNLKYWTRQPYLGFGVDAHSMLTAAGAEARPDHESFVGLKAHASTVAPAIVADPGKAMGDQARGDQAEGDQDAPDRNGGQRAGDPHCRTAAPTFGLSHVDDATVEGHGFSRAVSPASDPGFSPGGAAVRFATPDSLEAYLAGAGVQPVPISRQSALEECFFLGLRLNRGLDLRRVADEFGEGPVASLSPTIAELVETGLLERHADVIRLTPRGRLLSNEVFQRFLSVGETVT